MDNIRSYPSSKRANTDLGFFLIFERFFRILDMDSDTRFRYQIRIQYRLYPSDIRYSTKISNISE
jgi:hypothetical protein